MFGKDIWKIYVRWWRLIHRVHYGHRKFPTDLSALLLGDLYYTRLSLSGVSEHLSHSALLELYQILHANLSSNISKVCLQLQQQGLEESPHYLERSPKQSLHLSLNLHCYLQVAHNLKAEVCFLSQIRLLTLRILSQFEAELPPQAEVRLSVQILIKLDQIQETISSAAHSCECVPLCPG